jgi:hypothetical protein
MSQCQALHPDEADQSDDDDDDNFVAADDDADDDAVEDEEEEVGQNGDGELRRRQVEEGMFEDAEEDQVGTLDRLNRLINRISPLRRPSDLKSQLYLN